MAEEGAVLLELDHVVAAGADLRAAAIYMSQRMGFTLSRGSNDRHLRILLAHGRLELAQQDGTDWQWSRFHLRTRDIMAAMTAMRGRGFEPSEPVPMGGTGGAPAAYEMELSYPNPALPLVTQPVGPPRPQDAMEPERARAAVEHANTAVALTEVMVLAPDRGPVVEFYERLAGEKAGRVFSDGSLGIEGQTIPLGGGKRVSVVTAPFGTGPAARFAAEAKTGVFAVTVRVRSVRAAAEALRNGAVSSFFQDGRLVTSAAFPGDYFGTHTLIFEEAPPA